MFFLRKRAFPVDPSPEDRYLERLGSDFADGKIDLARLEAQVEAVVSGALKLPRDPTIRETR